MLIIRLQDRNELGQEEGDEWNDKDRVSVSVGDPLILALPHLALTSKHLFSFNYYSKQQARKELSRRRERTVVVSSLFKSESTAPGHAVAF